MQSDPYEYLDNNINSLYIWIALRLSLKLIHNGSKLFLKAISYDCGNM